MNAIVYFFVYVQYMQYSLLYFPKIAFQWS